MSSPPAPLVPSNIEDSQQSYKIKLEIFEGPLDLLLHLIKREEINIYDIPIARITDQYLEYLKIMEALDLSVAGDFLVMASTLIHIKSKMLLPAEPDIDGGTALLEDPRQDLVNQLLEHQRFKSAAEMLHSRVEVEQAAYARAPIESDGQNPEISASLFDLFEVFQRMLARLQERVEMEIVRDEITMAEKISEIRQVLAEHERVDVAELFERARSKRELVLTFLALLELVRLAIIRLVQSAAFGAILAIRRQEEPRSGTSSQSGRLRPV